VVWIQHNPDPRSEAFGQSILQLESPPYAPTVFVVSSGNERTKRLRNYAVSGAIVPRTALATNFKVLDGQFQYVEPIPSSQKVSRVVFLRYDAPVHLAKTPLAESIGSGVESGALFESVQPFSLRSSTLAPSIENFHLEDISLRAWKIASTGSPDLLAQIDALRAELVALDTRDFLGFLDVAILPHPQDEGDLHPAGVKHEPADYCCKCWDHRECIDRVAESDDSAKPLAEVLVAAAMLRKSAVPIHPEYRQDKRTNFVIGDGVRRPLGIVHPLNFNPETAEKNLRGKGRSTSLDSPYVILCAGEKAKSFASNKVNAGIAALPGGTNMGRSNTGGLRVIFRNELLSRFRKGTLSARVNDLIA